jgi:hypothetical protein
MLAAVLLIACGVSAQIDWSAPRITITTEAQLRELATLVNSGKRNFTGQTITLARDINLTQGNWVPIGWIQEIDEKSTKEFPFSGTFNGNNNVVSGIKISGERPRQGFFGFQNGTIKNLGVLGNIDGSGIRVGGLVASNDGLIENCFATVNVIGREVLGGLVGVNSNNGRINNSYATGSVSTNDLENVNIRSFGGLVGINRGQITRSYATGNVRGGIGVGGLVGHNIDNGGKISNSYATGNIEGIYAAGGLVGVNQGGTISNSYATGRVLTSLYFSIGALVGMNEGVIQNSYTSGSIATTVAPSIGNLLIGGDFAGNTGSGTVRNSRIINIQQMRQLNTFVGWDFNNIWAINANINNGFPHLRNVGTRR